MEGVEQPPEAASEVPAEPMNTEESDQYSGEYEWRYTALEHLNNNAERGLSPNFEIGTYTWRILTFPRGNQRKSCLALYLDAPESSLLPPFMCPTATFTFTLVNQLDESKSWSKTAPHTFTAQEADWGFAETVSLDVVYDEKNGFMQNGIIIIRVKVVVDKDVGDTSRRITGYVGLKNQGATCYMNSLLQYLYNVPFFRKAVYDMPTSEQDDPAKNMPLALQSLFFKLQYSRSTVATKDLTKSFGWTNQDAFLQHDVQELNRVLCEKLEETMKGTRVEKVINQLFEGFTINYIKCINIDFTSERKESFMDLQLDVKGCKNIYDSFDKYTENEVMDGANQYMAEGHGLQDAHKGVTFDSFPPVLQLQLKRFEYDFQRDTMVKINDRYEFFDEIDLDREDRKYLSPTGRGRNEINKYKLHSVLVHSGGVHGGHYYAYIRPDGVQWLRFDDERVTKEENAKAMDEQFGDDDAGGGMGGGMGGGIYGQHMPHMRFPKHSNAYMLVYVRLSDWDRIMCDVSKNDLDPVLLARFDAELAEKERRQKEKREAHMYVSVKVASDWDIRDQIASGHRAFDLVDHDLLNKDRGAFRVRKYTKFGEFKEMVAQTMGVPVSKQRLWAWGRRPNHTQRVTTTLSHVPDEMPLLEIKEFREGGFNSMPGQCKTALMDIRLYLETPGFRPPEDMSRLEGEPHSRKASRSSDGGHTDVLVFIKHYDPFKQSLSYVGKMYFPKDSKIQEIPKQVTKACGLPADTELEVFEEVKPEPTLMVEPLKRKFTFQEAKLEDGDIVVVQPRLTDEQAAKLKLPSIKNYLQYVQQRRIVLFKPFAQHSGANKAAQGPAVVLTPPSQPNSQGATAAAANGVAADGAQPAANSTGAEGAAAAGPQQPPGEFLLELRNEMSYAEVTEALSHHLHSIGVLPIDQDQTYLRLTAHSQYTGSPQRLPVKWRQVHNLAQMLMQSSSLMKSTEGARHLSGSHLPSDILYYEILDIPLEQLEMLKTIKVYFHKASGEFVSEHSVRLPKDSCTVHHLLSEVAKKLGPAYADKELRLVEVHSNKMYKLFSPQDLISDTLDDVYWRLRVEVVPTEEAGLDMTPTATTGERLIYCCHCLQDKSASTAPAASPLATPPSPAHYGPQAQPMDISVQGGLQGTNSPNVSQTGSADGGGGTDTGMQGPVQGPLYPMGSGTLAFNNVVTFGDPIIVRCGMEDTVATIKQRIQAKLGISDEELAKWRFNFCSQRGGVEYLQDTDCVGTRFARVQSQAATANGEQPFLGMEHEDDRPRRNNTHRIAYEKPVKITLQ